MYKTEQAQDVKKIEKFHSQLMRLMVAKESRNVTMETEWLVWNEDFVVYLGSKYLEIEKVLGQKVLYVTKWTIQKLRGHFL